MHPEIPRDKRKLIVSVYGKSSADDVARDFNISRSQVFKIWKEAGVSRAFDIHEPEEQPFRDVSELKAPKLPAVRHVLFGGIAPSSNRSVTAELFGDPLPGRSALDQRRSGGSIQ